MRHARPVNSAEQATLTLANPAQGSLGARRAAYEARWHAFGADVAGGKINITYVEVPWPADRPEDMQGVLLYGATGAAEVRPCTACIASLGHNMGMHCDALLAGRQRHLLFSRPAVMCCDACAGARR